MKTINGRPTKKVIHELCEKHGLQAHALDTYSWSGSFHWGHPKEKNNAAARLIVDELNEYDGVSGMTGCIEIRKRIIPTITVMR
jgi:hypothetical protein